MTTRIMAILNSSASHHVPLSRAHHQPPTSSDLLTGTIGFYAIACTNCKVNAQQISSHMAMVVTQHQLYKPIGRLYRPAVFMQIYNSAGVIPNRPRTCSLISVHIHLAIRIMLYLQSHGTPHDVQHTLKPSATQLTSRLYHGLRQYATCRDGPEKKMAATLKVHKRHAQNSGVATLGYAGARAPATRGHSSVVDRESSAKWSRNRTAQHRYI